MGFYNPTSPKADILGGITDLLKMYMQYMMIQKMYPKGIGAKPPENRTQSTQQGGIAPMGGTQFQQGGGLDMNDPMIQMLLKMFSLGSPSGMGQPPTGMFGQPRF